MNSRRGHVRGKPRLYFFLFIAECCLVLAVRAQNAPAPGDQSANATPPAAETSGNGASSEAAPPIQPATPYYPQSTEPSTLGEPEFGIVRRIPDSELGTPQYGIPYSSVFSLTGADGETVDPLTGHSLQLGIDQTPKLGEAEGTLSLGAADVDLPSVPFVYHAFAPDDADVKAGPLYLKFERLEADMIYSDNYKLSATDRKSEVLAIISLNMTLIAQLTDDLQLAFNGTLFYLPLQNDIGFEPPSLEGGLGFLLGAIPLLSSQVTYDTMIAGWDVRFADQFRTTTGSYSDSTRDALTIFNDSGVGQEPGRYVFHSGHTTIRSEETTISNDSQDNYFTVFANSLSAVTTNVVPGDVQVTARAVRTDLWYNQGDRGLPTSRDDFSILAESVRPNLRFTPYAFYDISHSSDLPGVYQTFRAGFFGPIDDQLFLRADAGYFLSNTGHSDILWTASLKHDAGPYTKEYLNVSRLLNDFNDEVVTSESYLISQILGPTVTAAAFAQNSQFQELSSGDLPNRSQQDFGVSLTWLLGPKTTLAATGIYNRQDFGDGFNTDTWTGSLELSRTITDTLFFRAFYQYQRYETNQPGNNYYEDLIFLSLVKYFP